jgi:uncharacterized membrane protein
MQVGSMADRVLIKKLYARMSNEQLLQLSKDEGKFLTSAAITILYQEFLKRKLDTSIFPVLRVYKVTEHQKMHQRLSQKKDIESVWEHFLDAKYKGKADQEILQDLCAMGLDYQVSYDIIHSMKAKAIELHEAHEKTVFKGLVLFLFGIGLLFINLTHINMETIASCCIILGLMKSISGLSSVVRYDRIVSHIQQPK